MKKTCNLLLQMNYMEEECQYEFVNKNILKESTCLNTYLQIYFNEIILSTNYKKKK